MLNEWQLLDIATAPIADADTYLDGVVKAPSNYKSPEAIAAYVTEKTAERLAMAATDLDLARITGVFFDSSEQNEPTIWLCRDDDDEAHCLSELGRALGQQWPSACPIVTFGGRRFDLPMLMRRALYRRVEFPRLNLDRFKGPHVDLCDVLSDREASRMRSLAFYVRRLSMGLTKPLSGDLESRIFEHGRWDDLRASLIHDGTAILKLGQWAGVIA